MTINRAPQHSGDKRKGIKMIIIETMKDQSGAEFSSDFIFQSEGDRDGERAGVYYRQTVNCLSSADLDLGTCHCASHSPWTIAPCTIEELRGVGIELSLPEELAQLIECAETSIAEIEEFCRLSYKFGSNPLPALRGMLPGFQVQFMHQTDTRSHYLTPEKPTVGVELADDGSVWLECYTEYHDGLGYYVPQAD